MKKLFLIFLCSVLLPIQADAASGGLHITVLFDGGPIAAAVLITSSGRRNQVVLQTEHVPENTYRHMRQTPFDVSLSAGKYDLYVHANVSPINSYMQTLALPIEINEGKVLDKTISIPAGRLQINADIAGQNAAGLAVDLMGGAAYKNRLPGFENFTVSGRLNTPVDVNIPPGKYNFKVWNNKSRQSQKGFVVVRRGQTVAKSLHLSRLHTGYLTMNIIMDGKPVLPDDASRYVSVSIRSAKNGQTIFPLMASAGDPGMKLPVGFYDVAVHVPALNASDNVFKNIHIQDGESVVRNISIQQSGRLGITAEWTGQPINITHFGDCFNYYNPFNSKRLGTLMGGASVSSGKCSSSKISNLVFQVSDLDGKVITETMVWMTLLPGAYNIAVWPKGQRQLEQKLHNVTISAGSVIQRKLEFRWPENNK